MSPYRGRPALERPTHAFGDRKSRIAKMIGAFALFALSAALVSFWISAFGTIDFYPVLPAFIGGLLLAHARAGSIELHPEERAGEVLVRRFGPTQRTRFEYADVVGVDIGTTTDRARVDYTLRLVLEGGRTIPLLKASSITDLEPARTALEGFFADNGVPPPPTRARVAIDGARIATDPATESEDVSDRDERLRTRPESR